MNERPSTPRTERLAPPATQRLAIALVAGFAIALAITAATPAPTAVSVLAGWDGGGVLLLLLTWRMIWRADARATQRRAGREDPGRTAVYFIVVVASAASLLAAIVLARRAKDLAPQLSTALVALSLGAVVVAWTLTHTSFTLRYARLYYRTSRAGGTPEGIGRTENGGVEFPGKTAPSYFDFAYFAFTLGMCFQVSDTMITSTQIRRTALLHATMSYAYSTVILAFALNLAFGMLG